MPPRKGPLPALTVDPAEWVDFVARLVRAAARSDADADELLSAGYLALCELAERWNTTSLRPRNTKSLFERALRTVVSKVLAGCHNRRVSRAVPFGDCRGRELRNALVASDCRPAAYEAREFVAELMGRDVPLDSRLAMVLRDYYGAGDAGPLTERELASKLGITTSRVNQLRVRALLTLRNRLDADDQCEVSAISKRNEAARSQWIRELEARRRAERGATS